MVYSFLAGWDASFRYDAMRFNEVANSAGVNVTWDAPVDRWETGINYHVSRDLVVKAVAQFTNADNTRWDMIPALQASFSF
jgi:phosphate-selective porin